MKRITHLTNGIKSIGKALGFSSWRHYEGSERHSRHRGYVWQSAQDADKDLTPTERKDGMAISRLLAANSGLYRGACQLLGRYAVVGMPQSQSANRKWAQAAEDGFREWAKIPEVTGRLTWQDIQRLWNTACDRDGDIGNILTNDDFPQLQLVEAHRIESEQGEPNWVDGVRVNKVGRAVAYRVKNGDSYSDIPAAAFLLIGEPSRATGTRHEPAWIAGLNHVRDTKEIGGLLKTVIKNEASIALIRRLNGGQLNNVGVDDWKTGTSPTGATVNQVLESIYGGRIPVLDVNEEIQSLATDRPSPNIQAFLEFIIRDFATGNGIPFEVVWNPEKLGGTAQRWVIASFQRRVNERQLLIERHATRIYGWVVAKLAKRGDIPTLPEDWYRVRWQKPAEVTVDVGREQAQDRADFQAGLIDPRDFYARQGLDADDVLASRVEWAKRVLRAAGHKESDQIPLWMLYNVSDLQVQTEQKIAAAEQGIDAGKEIQPKEKPQQ